MRALTQDEIKIVAGGWFLSSETVTSFRVGSSVVNAKNWGEVAAGIHNLTISWGLRDIQYFRAVGGHVVSPIGSLINYGEAQINWNNYGANTGISDQQVWDNFVNDVSNNGGGG